MAKVTTLCLLFIVSNILSVNYVVGENGFTIRVIHRDLRESHFYNPNLTYFERIERLIKQSKTRIKHIEPSGLGGRVYAEDEFTFMAKLGIGSFTTEPFKSYYFIIDTGSSLAWLECSSCRLPGNHCFHQTGEPFPENTSSSYQKLLCNPPHGHRHPLCDPEECIGEFCGYHTSYLDGSGTKGFLAKETFTFETIPPTLSPQRISDLVFGCGFDNKGFHFNHESNVAGILGLGWGHRSFLSQLGRKSLGRFSYCLQRTNEPNLNLTTLLHFGDNIPKSRHLHKTTIRKYTNLDAYTLVLEGITAAGTKLDIPKAYFARKGRKGGCILDSGSAFTHIPTLAYGKLMETLTNYFAHIHGLVRIEMPVSDLCYKRMGAKEGFRNFPTIIFHLSNGTNLPFEPESSFILGETRDGKENICLAIYSNDEENRMTIIGAYQQINKRFIFQTKSNSLYFGPENCGQT